MTTAEDDTQVYMAIMPKTTWSDVAKKLEACLADISTWMSANMLKINEEKTELIIFNPKPKAVHHIGCLQNTGIRPDNFSARLRQRFPVWSSKHTDDTATESTEFFCQALQGTAPQYLEELVVPYQPTRSLRSESGALLAVPTTRGVTYAREAVLARNAEMYKKFNKGDLDGVSAAYTEKAVLYEHGENPVVGRQAIKASLGKLASTVKTMELEKLEFFEQFNDNTAYTLDFTKCLDSSGRTVARYKQYFTAFFLKPKTEMSAREAVIGRTNELYEMFNKGEADALADGYTENAMLYINGNNPIVGRQAIKKSFSELVSVVKTMELEKWEYFEQFNDNTAYTLSFTKCFDPSGVLRGRYKGCLLWRKIDGIWFIENDIFNELPK
ncbi:hypothetical protein LSH36_185g05015 [Paralvinella palmiformis]|uniref:Nuclear transport factor 2 domain-containing protein n=1 Tax=Paralvinella palmiformis TaxID=53620 RepID=A0AAD9JRR0_9ANNE|nr:hypothetical protein LSH36_185g05015 [Paralvinella palmiformis]